MTPATRIEMYLATAAGDANAPADLPEPASRLEQYLNDLCVKIADFTAQTANVAEMKTKLDQIPIGRAATDEEFEEAMNND